MSPSPQRPPCAGALPRSPPPARRALCGRGCSRYLAKVEPHSSWGDWLVPLSTTSLGAPCCSLWQDFHPGLGNTRVRTRVCACVCCLVRSSFVGRHLVCLCVSAGVTEGHCPLRAHGPHGPHLTPGTVPALTWRGECPPARARDAGCSCHGASLEPGRLLLRPRPPPPSGLRGPLRRRRALHCSCQPALPSSLGSGRLTHLGLGA